MNRHDLTTRARRDSPNYKCDGDCSCGRWRARNHAREEIERMHAEHISAERIADEGTGFVRKRREVTDAAQ